MAGLRRYLFAAISLAVLTACTTVTVSEPLGTPVVISNTRDWEGLWLSHHKDENIPPFFVFVERATKGSFELCTVRKAPEGESPMAIVKCMTAFLRDVGLARFVFISLDDKGAGSLREQGAPLKGRWQFLLFERREDRVLLRFPDGGAVEKMIASGDVKGSVEKVGEYSQRIAIEGLDERLLEEWATSKRETIFGREGPVIYEFYKRN